ncbi:MAG: outer membrane beta-barrel domain-containing protein [Pseudobdellovibrionaceae bacterium]|jgi:outer membrane beta-barrel protein
MNLVRITLIFTLCVFAFPDLLMAQDLEDVFAEEVAEEVVVEMPDIIAVQARPKPLYREISTHFSFLPMDHFNTYIAAGASFTHYFSDSLGWEVFNFSYFQNNSTGLEDALKGKYGAVPQTFDIINLMGTTNVIYTPLYMKHLFMGEDILWGDLSLIAGGGIAQLEERGNTNVFNVGAALRLFSKTQWVYRLDLRQLFFTSSAVRPNMAITLGVSYNFEKSEESK